jgi:hypothetical protein
MPQAEFPTPLIVIDDDQWMYLYSSLDQLTKDFEPTFLDDITAAFDGLARPLRLVLGETGEGLRVELGKSESLLAQLQDHVDEFFTSWTRDDAPERLTDPREYTQSVTQAYGRKRERHKKRT